ncbi:MAG: hypothetical protein GY809_23435 [Planctomycetes bacterium]|nr:hypothetical protein [Planctomycetota bacterium]
MSHIDIYGRTHELDSHVLDVVATRLEARRSSQRYMSMLYEYLDHLDFSSHHEINGDEERITCGIGMIEFSLIEPVKEDTYTLVRYVTDNLQTEDEQEPVEEVLCRNVRALNFRYYDGLRWYEDWDSTEQLDALPMAVEVTLEMEPHEENARGSSRKPIQRSRYDQDYLDACTRLTQVFVLPMASPMEAVEAAADAAAEAEEAAASEGGAGQGGGGP